ncbi:MAG: serine/threonine-protein phosphatase [Gemmatimonadetes bacterium]|nr:serine/threonine-protein phosphatase [Gemmatimonadota bacterium]MYF72725.1 serine/threonine-protein phosphatase [Gemmatimonadota bacterium]MYK54315.1 serine/threonine-protein phosphatase [Gemmatimonadota bacterium]
MDLLDGRFAAQQIPGGREYQEDDYGLIEPGDPDADGSEVLLIADGMGGHVSGGTASRTVVKTFVEIYHDTDGPIPDRLRVCLNAANDALAEAIKENPELEGMGSTVVAAVVSQHGLDWISVGDSPLWLFRDGKLHRLNADHSMAPVLANLVAVGRMTEEEAATDPKRHALRSAVMGDEIHMIDVSSQPVAIRKSDRLLLASDGLMTLEDEEIAGILQDMQDDTLSEVVEALIHAVEEVGHPNQDNTTVLLYAPETDCGVEELPFDAVQEESKQREGLQRQGRKKSLFWISLYGVLIALGVVYWLTSHMSDKEAAIEPPEAPQEEPTKQDVSPPATGTETITSDLPEVQTGGKSPQAEPPAKDAPAQLDTGKVNEESSKKETEDIPAQRSTTPDTTTQSKGTR